MRVLWTAGVLLAALGAPAPRSAAQQRPPIDDNTTARLGAGPAGIPKLALDDTAYRRAVGDVYWQWLASVPCSPAPWRPDLSSPTAFDLSTRALRRAFLGRLGPLGTDSGA